VSKTQGKLHDLQKKLLTMHYNCVTI